MNSFLNGHLLRSLLNFWVLNNWVNGPLLMTMTLVLISQCNNTVASIQSE